MPRPRCTLCDGMLRTSETVQLAVQLGRPVLCSQCSARVDTIMRAAHNGDIWTLKVVLLSTSVAGLSMEEAQEALRDHNWDVRRAREEYDELED